MWQSRGSKPRSRQLIFLMSVGLTLAVVGLGYVVALRKSGSQTGVDGFCLPLALFENECYHAYHT